MSRTPSLEHTVISIYEQNIFIKDVLKLYVLSSWTFYSLEKICSFISWKLFQLQTKTFGMSRDYWKSWEQLYEHYCYNSVKSMNVSHNIESKHAAVWTMDGNSKLQYGLKFPDITETNGYGHSEQNNGQCRTECLFLICIRRFQMYDETKADIFIWMNL